MRNGTPFTFIKCYFIEMGEMNDSIREEFKK